jgi:hypothetical protein
MAAAKFTVEWDGPVSPHISARGVTTATTATQPVPTPSPSTNVALWCDTQVSINTSSATKQ